MRRLYIFGLMGLAVIFINSAWAEEITISTYYPAPYGVYRNFKTTEDTYLATESGNVGVGTETPNTKLEVDNVLKITPYTVAGTDPQACGLETEGAIYYKDSESRFYYCDGSEWKPFGGLPAPDYELSITPFQGSINAGYWAGTIMFPSLRRYDLLLLIDQPNSPDWSQPPIFYHFINTEISGRPCYAIQGPTLTVTIIGLAGEPLDWVDINLRLQGISLYGGRASPLYDVRVRAWHASTLFMAQ